MYNVIKGYMVKADSKDNVSMVDKMNEITGVRKSLAKDDLTRIQKLVLENIEKRRDYSALLDIICEHLSLNKTGILGGELENIFAIFTELFQFIEKRQFDDAADVHIDNIIIKAVELSKNYKSVQEKQLV